MYYSVPIIYVSPHFGLKTYLVIEELENIVYLLATANLLILAYFLLTKCNKMWERIMSMHSCFINIYQVKCEHLF